MSNSSSDYYSTHDGEKETEDMTIVTSSPALQKGLLAWVKGQMAPAWVQHLSNRLLKQKIPDNMTHSYQSICTMYAFEFKASCQSWVALKTAAPGCITQDRHLQKPRCRSSALSLLCPVVWVKTVSHWAHGLWIFVWHLPLQMLNLTSMGLQITLREPRTQNLALTTPTCLNHADIYISLELAIDSSCHWWWWGR